MACCTARSPRCWPSSDRWSRPPRASTDGATMKPRRKSVPRIVATAGGKGGVGKSTIAANLALAIGRLGHRVTLVDADLGAANLHTMLGVTRPQFGLADFFDQRI